MSATTRSLFAAALAALVLSFSASLAPAQRQCKKSQQMSTASQASTLQSIAMQQNYRLTSSQLRTLMTTYQTVVQNPQMSATDIQTLLANQNPNLTNSQLQMLTTILQTAQQQTALTTMQNQALLQQMALMAQMQAAQTRGYQATGQRYGVRHEVADVTVLRSKDRLTAPAVLPAVSYRDMRPR